MVTIQQMNLNKLTIIATFIAIFATLTAASPAELTVFPEESSTRIDSFTSYEVEIENVGPVEDTYTFTSSSTSEIDIAPQKIDNLEPGASETVNVWYNPSQDRDEGTYSYTLTATSRATGDSYTGQITAEVIREHDVNIEVSETSQTVCRGEQATYTMEVTNDGIQQEEYQLSTDYGQLSQNTVTLEDGETKEVTLTATSQEEAQESFNVRATSTTSYAQTIQNIQFNAETCYSSETSVTPEDQEVAAGNAASYDVTIRNTGTNEDEFTLSSNTGEFTENPVTVEGESSETVQLQVTPEELGQTNIELSSEGKSSSTSSASLNSYNGNDMDVSFEAGTVNVCETDQASVNALVENTGETEETFTLQTDRGTIQTEELTLEPGESDTVETVVDATQLETGSHEVTVTATASTFEEPKKSQTSTVNVENCWDISMNVVPQVASAGENRSTVYEINLENTGTRENTYELSYTGPEWVSIKPDNVTVERGQTGNAYMYAGIPFKKEGNVQITATAVGTNTTASQTVELVIGKEIEQAIQDSSNNLTGITGAFSQAVTSTGAAGKLLLAILLAAGITGTILLRN